MDLRVTPSMLTGTVSAISSKSDAHRLLICAALADQPTQLDLTGSSEDIDATMNCLMALGATFAKNEKGVAVRPITQVPPNPLLDCAESGSTLRFLLPVASALTTSARFTGRGRLPERPIGELKTAMEAHGVTFSGARLPFAITGQLQPGNYTIPGNISSQYITGLLLAQAALAARPSQTPFRVMDGSGDMDGSTETAETNETTGPTGTSGISGSGSPGNFGSAGSKGIASTLKLETQLESSGYVDITLHALQRFQIVVETTDSGWRIPSGQSFQTPGTIRVDGDWSNAAFFLAAGAIGQPVTVTGLDLTSPQGDKKILEILREFGAGVVALDGSVTVSPGMLHGITIDVREIPDALPILAVVAACAAGETRFSHGERLRLKESDRLKSTAELIRALGGQATELPDGLIIQGQALAPFRGGIVNGYNDHRIIMAAAVAATVASGDVTISGAKAVGKSYPHFFADFNALGGITDVL